MRHKTFGRKLNRDVKERKALFKSLVQNLVAYGSIETTASKAKAVRRLAERLVTKAKSKTGASFMQVASILNRKNLIDKMLNEVAPLFDAKNGGYVRILKLGTRAGDNAEKVRMEWTVKAEPQSEKSKAVKPETKEKEKQLKKEIKVKGSKKSKK